MATHSHRMRLAPARGKVTAILMTAFLGGLASGCAPQPAPPPTAGAGGPSPSAAVMWLQKGGGGTRDVYYISSDGNPVHAGQLPATGPSGYQGAAQPQAAIANCVWTPFGKVC